MHQLNVALLKKSINAFLIIICCLTLIASAQVTQPVTRAEYVRLLYSIQKDPQAVDKIIQEVRQRGIDFDFNDALRGLTRTKSNGNSELVRVLEQANRKRQNPASAAMPSDVETAAILEKARQKTLEAVGEMPDFVVKQQIQRSASFAGTGNFRNLDKLIVAVSYRSTGQEQYRLLAINGMPQVDQNPKGSYEDAGGTSSTGEFVNVLATIFKPESETDFKLVDTDTVRNRPALIFEYSITKEKARQQIISAGSVTESAVTGMRGRIWVDREVFRVLRVESEATEIPEGFPVTAARRTIDYDWAQISDEKYLLPLVADVRLTIREKNNSFETRNLIRFVNYQKFGSEVTIGPEDSEPVKEEKP
jgi:hypothetical protein